ncbi:cobyric acid synthase [Alkalicoccus luteus]|uniref:Cobyric acid synthase n=1 Tax=Alkalicoccus luteus TaxID=1237094 RepID=A0A969TWK2_9BACI|nr:cobyric acid synthase [Alkalicoccus luteus]NJP39141.1 cobyric acid synthase [Alkalicoccus luteus]
MKAAPLMIQGTHSDAGKSVLTAGLCRVFARQGFKTAPFKSQNMALNSYITADGLEIGRAQGMQAEACGIEADTDMNPILLKPSGYNRSQVVVNGKVLRAMEATEYREQYFEKGLQTVTDAYNRLASRTERIVIEGAGSPAEINLQDREIVNMRIARMADAPVLLAADIDRGGVFASIVGTLELLSKADRKRVKGFIINKFRGDQSLLQPGLDWLEEYTGKPVAGLMPYLPDLRLEEEDSLGLASYGKETAGRDLDIAVIRFPYLSNYTDLDPFRFEPDCAVRFVERPEQLGEPDLLILPGSKTTVADGQFLRTSGLNKAIAKKAGEIPIIGICGGYQLLGKTVEDPSAADAELKLCQGLNLVPEMYTVMNPEKTTVRMSASVNWEREVHPLTGYELHMGQTVHRAPVWLSGGSHGSSAAVNNVYGTYMHDIFHNDTFRHALLDSLRRQKALPPVRRVNVSEEKTKAFDRLADAVEAHLDMELIERLMNEGRQTDELA